MCSRLGQIREYDKYGIPIRGSEPRYLCEAPVHLFHHLLGLFSGRLYHRQRTTLSASGSNKRDNIGQFFLRTFLPLIASPASQYPSPGTQKCVPTPTCRTRGSSHATQKHPIFSAPTVLR
ncbi:hypothetical protein MN608_11590 [Microdochium nivale]|nr:hypothetical protein MN608_11590 [Microdochium nivale]